MLTIATNWETLSSLGTALGTLVLAIATFASVRSGGRSARISETALREQRRPVLTNSRLSDTDQKVMFVDRHWVRTEGGRAVAEVVDGVVYLTVSLRNVGQGMAVCQGWTVGPRLDSERAATGHSPLEHFRTQAIDIYVPAGDIGMWQGALRDPDDPVRSVVAQAIDDGEAISLELLYTDLVGEQRTITRLGLLPANDGWYTNMSRHWHIDHDGPRPDHHATEASQEILGHVQQAAETAADDVTT